MSTVPHLNTKPIRSAMNLPGHNTSKHNLIVEKSALNFLIPLEDSLTQTPQTSQKKKKKSSCRKKESRASNSVQAEKIREQQSKGIGCRIRHCCPIELRKSKEMTFTGRTVPYGVRNGENTGEFMHQASLSFSCVAVFPLT